MAFDSVSYNLIRKSKFIIDSSIETINNDISNLSITVNTILNDLVFYNEVKDIKANDIYKITNDELDIDFTKALYDVKILDKYHLLLYLLLHYKILNHLK